MNAVPLLIPLVETGNLGTALLVIGGLLLLSASFSGSETALNALQPMDREALKSAGKPGERVLALESDARETLAAILMGNELVNISLSTVCAGLLLALAPDKPWLNLLVATPLLILFGEVSPKSIALASPRRFALFISRPLSAWTLLVSPLRRLLAAFVGIFLRLLGAEDEPARVLQEDQVRKLIDEGHEAGHIKKLEHQFIDRLFHFSDTPVSRLMTPRPDIIAFPVTIPYETLVAELKAHRVSRVPIYQGRLDNVLGVLLTKDLLRFKGSGEVGPRALKSLLQDPYFVPTTKRADDLLHEFQIRRTHMAVVVDEHGSLSGLCTLDDLLGELVGEMLDEDERSDEISRIAPNHWAVPGSADLEDFADETGILLPEGDYHTVAGWVFAALGHVPEVGERVQHEDVVFTVAGVEGRRITELAIAPAPPESTEESG